MAGLCTFVMKSGARIEFRADDVTYDYRNNDLVGYKASGVYGTHPMYIRIADVDAILWLPDSENE